MRTTPVLAADLFSDELEEARQALRRQEREDWARRVARVEGKRRGLLSDDSSWRDSELAPRIRAMLNELMSAGPKGVEMAAIIAGGIAVDIKVGKHTEESLTFREGVARRTLADIAADGTRPAAVWQTVTAEGLRAEESAIAALPIRLAEVGAERMNALGIELAKLGYESHLEVTGAAPAAAQDLSQRIRDIWTAQVLLGQQRARNERGYKNAKPEKLERMEDFATEQLGIDTRSVRGDERDADAALLDALQGVHLEASDRNYLRVSALPALEIDAAIKSLGRGDLFGVRNHMNLAAGEAAKAGFRGFAKDLRKTIAMVEVRLPRRQPAELVEAVDPADASSTLAPAAAVGTVERLGPLFHGTIAAFDKFDPDRVGRGVGWNDQGRGIYMTTDGVGFGRYFAREAVNNTVGSHDENSDGVVLAVALDPSTKILDLNNDVFEPNVSRALLKSMGLRDDTIATIREADLRSPERVLMVWLPNSPQRYELSAIVQAMGYDGIVRTETRLPDGNYIAEGARSVVVYDFSKVTVGGEALDLPPRPPLGEPEPALEAPQAPAIAREHTLEEPAGVDADVVAAPAPDFAISASLNLGAGGAKTKFRDNVAALRLLQTLDKEDRAATPDEQAVLVRYVGWGGMPQAFDPANESWRSQFDTLREVLQGDEYDAARRSTQDAHYTALPVVEAIYAGLQRMGFEGGEILEPAVGSGNFVGMVPEALRERSKFTGVELDLVTAAIARHLYPSARIINKGYQDVVIPAGRFDAVIGNPPFGSQTLHDPHHREFSKLSIHNYFLAKSVDKLREGGVMAVVVSSYFMDAQDKTAREWIADRAHLVGAIRLPNTAFKQNAMTEVTTDIVFLKKAAAGEITDKAWVNTGTVIDRATGGKIAVNDYFVSKPDMMLGEMQLTGTMYRSDMPACIAPEGQDLGAELARAVGELPEGVYVARAHEAQPAKLPEAGPEIVPEDVKIGAFFIDPSGRIARRLPDLMDERLGEWAELKSAKAGERVRSMVEVRDELRALMRAERSEQDDGAIEESRRRLNVAYDEFVRKHGFISSMVNRQTLHDDPDYPLLHSLERDYDKGVSKEGAQRNGVAAREPSAKKADIFTKRVMKPARDITQVESAKDALVISMNDRGGVDMPLLVRLTGKTEAAVLQELDGLVYRDPTSGRWDTADKYLTGNVKLKLEQARQASARDDAFAKNVAALEAVQPADIEPVDIGVQLGATWVPASDVSDFVGHLMGAGVRRQISYQPALGKWLTKINGGDHTTRHVTWGTSDAPADKLIEAILENRTIQVKEEVGRDDNGFPIMRVNEEKTAAANQKADEIRQAFVDWIWVDKDRRDRLARIYNDTFNTNVVPKYDGSHLTLPGASAAIELRPHQKDAIWRGIQEGGGLFDHVVGAGKTFVKIGVAMESRRMGLLSKPMLAVPNHLLLQWKDAFYALYPDAKVLVAEKTDFKKENREKLFAKIATGDWDAVVVGHSSLKKIGMPPETLEAILREQIDDLTSAVLQLKSERGDRVTIKEMEKAKDRMEAKLKRHAETGSKDRVVTFDELGVDALLVDELHEFKNLFITTSLSRISGLGNLAGSDKAFDLFVKARYLQQTYDGRGVYGGTGTPISNTIAELYTVQRYMRYDDLKARGIQHFDAWASAFGQVVTGWELDATGVNYKLNSRFAKFQNVPELVAMYRSFADVITQQDLEAQAAERGQRFPVPKIKGGRPTNVIVERSPKQATFMGVQEPVRDAEGQEVRREDGSKVMAWNTGSIIHRMEHLPKDPREDNPLKVTNDARKAGLDFRLIDPHAGDFAGSKVNAMIDNAMAVYDRWNDRKGTQLIFCDLSTPKKSSRVVAAPAIEDDEAEIEPGDEPVLSMDELLAGGSSFSVYDDIKAKLIARGVPEDQIRYIHDAGTDVQKAKLFAEMNRGDVRFLLGSTAKMGAGTNVQRLLVGMHDLDCPWRPSDLEQRRGRIVRQGNAFYEADPDGFEIAMYRYSTKQTYDSRMWQTVEVKANGIEQFRRGDTLVRVIEDIAGEAANAAEMKAAATGNPLIFQQVKLSADLKKIEALASNHRRNHHSLESRAQWLEEGPARAAAVIDRCQAEIALRDANTVKPWVFMVGKQQFTSDTKEALTHAALACMKSALAQQPKTRSQDVTVIPVGVYRGFKVGVYAYENNVQFTLEGQREYSPGRLSYGKGDEFSVSGFVTRLDNALAGFEDEIAEAARGRDRQALELVKVREELSKPFAQQARLEVLRKDVSDVLVELKKAQADAAYVSLWSPASEAPAPVEIVPADVAAAHGLVPHVADVDRGVYSGPIIAISPTVVLQDIGMKMAAIHDRSKVDGHMREGVAMRLAYQGGRATAQQIREQGAAEMGR